MKRIYSAEAQNEYLLESEDTCNYKVAVNEISISGDENDDSLFDLDGCFSSREDAIAAADDYVENLISEYPDADVNDEENGFVVTLTDGKIIAVIVYEANDLDSVETEYEVEMPNNDVEVEYDDDDDEAPYGTLPDDENVYEILPDAENEELDEDEDDIDECIRRRTLKESVHREFARRRRLYEADDDEDENEDEDETESETEDEESTLSAVVITVKSSEVDKAKEELIDAGVEEDDIEILGDDEGYGDEEDVEPDENEDNEENESINEDDDEDDDSENKDDDNDEETVDIKIDVNSIMPLKDYLDKKGIDLEEKIGGELVSSDDDSEDGSDENDGNDEKGGDDDDMDYSSFGDIFGDDDESSDEK